MTDDALIEAMARAMAECSPKDWLYADDWFKNKYIEQAMSALAVARPIIEAQERERWAEECDHERKCLGYSPAMIEEVRDYAKGYDAALRHMAETLRGERAAAALKETGYERV